MKRVYFSYTMSGREFLEEAHAQLVRYAKKLAPAGYRVFVPPLEGPADPAELFVRDLKELLRADLLVVFVNPKQPSYGVGAEVAYGVWRSIPILMVCDGEWSDVSVFLRGMFSYNDAAGLVMRHPLSADAMRAACDFLIRYEEQRKKPKKLSSILGLIGEEEE